MNLWEYQKRWHLKKSNDHESHNLLIKDQFFIAVIESIDKHNFLAKLKIFGSNKIYIRWMKHRNIIK
jgi:hypothetical protein